MAREFEGLLEWIKGINPWDAWVIASAIVFVFFVGWAAMLSLMHYKRKRIIRPYILLFTGVMLSAILMLYPLYYVQKVMSGGPNVFLSFFASLQHSIRLFLMDGGFGDVKEIMDAINEANLNGETSFIPEIAYNVYIFNFGFLYIFAPLMTFTFILSFFKTLRSYYVFYIKWVNKEIHVFSELNEKSLAMAKSIAFSKNEGKCKLLNSIRNSKPIKLILGDKKRLNGKKRIVFTDVIRRNEEDNYELVEEAMELNAVLFQKDLNSLKLNIRKHNIYLVSDDEAEKIRHAKTLIDEYKSRSEDKMALYIFSDSIESKCFLESYSEAEKREINMKIERINDIRFLIYHYLDEHGIELFRGAKQKEKFREISVAVVGLGKYGIELVKTLLWYCQLPGYKINIYAFEKNDNAKVQFGAMFPGLMLEKDIEDRGDMKYSLRITDNTDITTKAFSDELEKISQELTHIFVCLGTDSENLTASIAIKRLMARLDHNPNITTVLYDSDIKENVNYPWPDEGESNGSQMSKFNVHIIGDRNSFYSEETLLASSLVNEGLIFHKRWGDTEKNFYMDDYNFYSSVSSALHRRLRKKIDPNEIDKTKGYVFPFCREGFYAGTVFIKSEVIKNNVDKHKTNTLGGLKTEMAGISQCVNAEKAYRYYSELNVDDRKAVLSKLEKKLIQKREKSKDASYTFRIPMLEDREAYIGGYKEILDKASKWEGYEKDIIALMPSCIAAVRNPENVREALLGMDYSESNPYKKEIEEYVAKAMNALDGQAFLAEYVANVKCAAYIEHIRWNAYMRTEGFLSTNGAKDTLNLLHPDIVPMDKWGLDNCLNDI